MNNALPIATVALLIAMSGATWAQTESQPKQAAAADPATAAELAAIRDNIDRFTKAFNSGNAKEVASFWTSDGEYVDEGGRRFAGRAAIGQGYAKLFEANASAKLRVAVESLRLVSPGVAIEDGSAVVEPAADGASGISRYTAVHVKVEGKWLMASVREEQTPIPADVQSASDLEWLVGDWVAEERGVKIESTVRWVAGKRFLERRYTTTHLDGSKSSGLQVIGWNPRGGRVQSWDFSPDGGHAIGAWSPTEGGWKADVAGITGDGLPTSAVNILRRLDDRAYAWQSVQRSVGAASLPDTTEVIIKRASGR